MEGSFTQPQALAEDEPHEGDHPLRRLDVEGRRMGFHFPQWLQGRRPQQVFGQLSGCMASVRVTEEQLHLPVSLSALSGNRPPRPLAG